ncbi:hypothetical protein, partial [Klebsiella pneumoniae]|uniref:hypothetical protein n=1 Tax=Klebsiella pneumoniae TaxID=573 RepID=UPI003D36B04A
MTGQALQAGGQALRATAGPLQGAGRCTKGRSLQPCVFVECCECTFQALCCRLGGRPQAAGRCG